MGKLDLELEVLKCKIHEEDILDDFKENLEKRLNEKYESYEPKHKSTRTFKIYNYIGRAVAACACFMVLSTCAFTDEIEGMFNLLFANTNQNIETAYEEGNMKEIDSEYQTYDGVSLKVDYASVSDDEICIMLNMNTELNYQYVYINNIELKDENNNFVYSTGENDQKYIDIRKQINLKKIDKTNSSLILTFSKNNSVFEQYKNLKLNVYEINFLLNDNEKRTLIGNWNFEINLNEKS